MNFKHRLKYSLNAKTITILLIGIVVVINIISLRHFLRLDLTKDKQFTISSGTEQTVENLDDVVTIKTFISRDLPPNVSPIVQRIKDILSEYKANANGNVVIRYTYPDQDEKAKTEAQTLGIPEIPLEVFEQDKRSVQKAFIGIAILYGDKKEVIPLINLDNLEYDLTSSIKKVTADKLKTIGFLSGHDEHGISQGIEAGVIAPGQAEGDYSNLAQALQKNYQVKTVTIESGQAIKDVDTLIVAGPKQALSERDLYEIDQFVMNGGTAIFLIDQIKIAEGLQASLNNTNLDDWLNNLGLKISKNVILDSFPYNAMATFSQGFFSFTTNYPFWVKLAKPNLSKDNPMVAQLEAIVLPWSSSLEITQKEGINVETLGKTSDKAYGQLEPFNFDPNGLPQVSPNDLKQFTMMALLTGKLKSYFADKPIPSIKKEEPTDKDAKSSTIVTEPTPETRQTVKQAEKDGHILVVGDSDFAANNFVRPQQFPQNLTFMLNAIDYLTLDPSLISIRSKGTSERPLEDVSEAKKTFLKAVGIVGMPIMVILYGIFRNWQRKRNKKEVLAF